MEILKGLVLTVFISMIIWELLAFLLIPYWNLEKPNIRKATAAEIKAFDITREALIKARYSPTNEIKEERWYEVDGIKFMIIRVGDERFIKIQG